MILQTHPQAVRTTVQCPLPNFFYLPLNKAEILFYADFVSLTTNDAHLIWGKSQGAESARTLTLMPLPPFILGAAISHIMRAEKEIQGKKENNGMWIKVSPKV